MIEHGIVGIGNTSRIFFSVLEHLGFQYLPNREKASRYISEVLKHVKIIVESEKFPDNRVDLAHATVKKLYDGTASAIGQIVSADNLAKIYQALSAARVYYWCRHYEGKPGEDILEIINERFRYIKRGEVRTNSNELFIKQLRDLDSTSPRLAEHNIEQIKENCLADIAELEEMVLRVVVTRLKKW